MQFKLVHPIVLIFIYIPIGNLHATSFKVEPRALHALADSNK